MSLKRRITVFLIVALVVAGVVAVYYMPQWQQTQAASKAGFRGGRPVADPVPVLAIAAKTADVPVYLDGVGTGKALNTVTVRPQVDGKLINVSFTEGQDVEKGYVLAKIDPVTYQAAYDQTVAKKAQDEAQLANAKLDLERYTRLAATNAVNKQQLDTQRAMVAQFEAQVQLDQAAIDNARAMLSYTNVVAPISGRTGIRQVDEGNIVKAAEPTGIVILTQLRPISVFFNLPQQELPELNRAQAQSPLSVDALGPDGKTVLDKGKVVVIDNQVDQTTGTVKLKAQFANDDEALWPGQFVNVRLLIDTLHRAVTVSSAAIQRGPNGPFVYVVQADGTASVRPVSVAQQDENRAVVTGVTASEDVVTTGFAQLANGRKVQVGREAPGQGSHAEAASNDNRRGTQSNDSGMAPRTRAGPTQ